MKLQESRKQELAELAEAVIEMNSPQAGQVDLAKILKAKGIKLHSDRFVEQFDALISLRNGTFHIHLNLSRMDSPICARARFTIAHELGHYYIDEHRCRLVEGAAPHPSYCGMFDSADGLEEQEADCFAANLLMPPSRFTMAAAGLGTPLETILALSRKFGSSYTASALQYTKLVSDRCLVMRWKASGELAWSIPGVGYRTDGFRVTRFKKSDQLPPDSATGEVLSGSKPHSRGVLTMAAVFQQVALTGNRNTLVTEEAISLGDYGVLTIISDHAPPDQPPSARAIRRRQRNQAT